uniref:Uncharacterized protein n=1 Tax=Setaria italica TaxID=4555 RepID=K3ZG92_SETIT
MISQSPESPFVLAVSVCNCRGHCVSSKPKTYAPRNSIPEYYKRSCVFMLI